MVGAVEDEVVGGDYVEGVGGGEVLAVGVVLDVWVEAWSWLAWCIVRGLGDHSGRFQVLDCAVYFVLVYCVGVVEDLAVQV